MREKFIKRRRRIEEKDKEDDLMIKQRVEKML